MWMLDKDKRDDRRELTEIRADVREQTQAMGAAAYEVATRTRDNEVAYRRVTADELGALILDLRSQNRAGTEVAIRPLDAPDLVLLRGIANRDLERLSDDGFQPVATVTTFERSGDRPVTVDAWVRMDTRGVPPPLRDAMAQVLAARYGSQGDGRPDEFGQLAGFSSREGHLREMVQSGPGHPERYVAPGSSALANEALGMMTLRSDAIEKVREQENARQPGRDTQRQDRQDTGKDALRPTARPTAPTGPDRRVMDILDKHMGHLDAEDRLMVAALITPLMTALERGGAAARVVEKHVVRTPSEDTQPERDTARPTRTTGRAEAAEPQGAKEGVALKDVTPKGERDRQAPERAVAQREERGGRGR